MGLDLKVFGVNSVGVLDVYKQNLGFKSECSACSPCKKQRCFFLDPSWGWGGYMGRPYSFLLGSQPNRYILSFSGTLGPSIYASYMRAVRFERMLLRFQKLDLRMVEYCNPQILVRVMRDGYSQLSLYTSTLNPTYHMKRFLRLFIWSLQIGGCIADPNRGSENTCSEEPVKGLTGFRRVEGCQGF